MNTTYVIMNKRSGRMLSSFYPNALGSARYSYRKNSWYSFATQEEASEAIKKWGIDKTCCVGVYEFIS